MRIWLKEGVDPQAEELGRWGVHVKTHRTGRNYIEFDYELYDPTAELPIIPDEYVDRVTVHESIHRGFRTDGIYRHEGAELVARRRAGPFSMSSGATPYQYICIGGPTVGAVMTIYSMFRLGTLLPEEDWEAEQYPAPTQIESAQVDRLVEQFSDVDELHNSSDEEIYEAVRLTIEKLRQEQGETH